MFVSAHRLNNCISFKHAKFAEATSSNVRLNAKGSLALSELGTSVTYLQSFIDLNVSTNFANAAEIQEAMGEMANVWHSALLNAYRNNKSDKFPLFLASYIENRRNSLGVVEAMTKAANTHKVNLY